MPKFADIPKFLDSLSSYEVDVSWGYINTFLEESSGAQEVHLNPDFQRGHVWTARQKQRYIEYCLRAGNCANRVVFACEDFGTMSISNPWYLVDGLQRITAVQEFLDDKVPAFGYTRSQYSDKLHIIHHRFEVRVIDTDRKGMLQLYLDLNAGGTPHAEAEIEKVRRLLKKG